MKKMVEVRNAVYAANLDKKKLENELSQRLRFAIETELNEINKQFGSMPKSINVEMISTRVIGSENDNFILNTVEVHI